MAAVSEAVKAERVSPFAESTECGWVAASSRPSAAGDEQSLRTVLTRQTGLAFGLARKWNPANTEHRLYGT